MGENGLFSNAKKSSEKTKIQSALEELNLKIMDVQTIKGGEATLQDIVEVLKDDKQYTYIVNLEKTAFLSNEGEIVSDSDITGKITNDVTSIRVIHKGYEFEINNNLKVSYIGSKGVQQEKKYTISLDANGGTITENEIEIMNGDLYGELPEPTRENCNFEGWYTSKKVSEGTKIEATDEFSFGKDQTLYAIWSHTHTAANGATLISGTTLGDDGTYSLSGGCYTISNSYSVTCGSVSWIPTRSFGGTV